MLQPSHTPFAAVFRNEVLLNSKRILPYALIILFVGNALLWWAKGPAVALGWATNSDFYIARNLKAFAFLLGLPIFTAIMMGDAVTRDFRFGIDSLIFSKPLNRASYLLGKFFGNFFVLVCCQAAFTLTLLVLQAFRPSEMVVQAVQVVPYFKHFFFFVVIPHLALAACYFTVGALTRNTKIVYGLAICFYPVYIGSLAFILKGLAPRWRNLLDPFLLNTGPSKNGFGNSADFLNQFIYTYSADMIANRAALVFIAAVCLTILCIRFRMTESAGNVQRSSTLNISTASDRIYFDVEMFPQRSPAQEIKAEPRDIVKLPDVSKMSNGFWATLKSLIAALDVEFRLLGSERSLVVLMPLTIFLSIFDLAFFPVAPAISYSTTYASGTAQTILLFLVGITIFYTGEAIHRDREVRIEPVLWATATPNNVLLLSKWLATLLLAVSPVILVGLTAIAIQLLRGHTPLNISAYFITYGVVLFPSIIVMTSLAVVLNVLLRNKYLSYVVGVATAAGLFYLYSNGYNHWLYNPVLYGLWTYADLTGAGNNQTTILIHRIYCIAIGALCLALAHLFFQRKSTSGFRVNAGLSSRGWSILIISIASLLVIITGFMITSRT